MIKEEEKKPPQKRANQSRLSILAFLGFIVMFTVSLTPLFLSLRSLYIRGPQEPEQWEIKYNQFISNWRDIFSEIRSTEVNQTSIAIWWVYNAGFLIKTHRYVVAINLVLPWVRNFDRADLAMIDVLLITHEHGDHNSPDLVWKMRRDAFIVGPGGLWWKNVTYNNMTITTIPSMHNSSIAFPVGYIVTTENGIRIIHTDDNSYCYPEMSRIGLEMRPNVLLLNMWCGLESSHGYINETAKVVKSLQPELVILMHLYELDHEPYLWGTWEQAEKIKDNLGRQCPDVKVIIPSWGEKYIYTKL